METQLIVVLLTIQICGAQGKLKGTIATSNSYMKLYFSNSNSCTGAAR